MKYQKNCSFFLKKQLLRTVPSDKSKKKTPNCPQNMVDPNFKQKSEKVFMFHFFRIKTLSKSRKAIKIV